MKSFQKIALVFLMVIVLFLSAPLNAFDKTPGELKEFGFAPNIYRNLSDSVVSIITFGSGYGWDIVGHDSRGKSIYDSFEGFFSQQGSGVTIKAPNGGIYILTNWHVVVPHELTISLGPSSSLITPCLKIKYQVIYILQTFTASAPPGVRCELVWSDQETDIAILKPTKNEFLKPIPYEIIEFEMMGGLEKDDAITVVTGYRDPNEKEFPLMNIFPERKWWYEARQGKVLSVEPMPFNQDALPWFSPNDVTTDVKIYPGDSGSPVFIYINGKPYLFGLIKALSYNFDEYEGIKDFRSYFTRITDIVLRYLSTPGLD